MSYRLCINSKMHTMGKFVRAACFHSYIMAQPIRSIHVPVVRAISGIEQRVERSQLQGKCRVAPPMTWTIWHLIYSRNTIMAILGISFGNNIAMYTCAALGSPHFVWRKSTIAQKYLNWNCEWPIILQFSNQVNVFIHRFVFFLRPVILIRLPPYACNRQITR